MTSQEPVRKTCNGHCPELATEECCSKMISHPAGDKPVLFTADLHLDPVRPRLAQLFIEFLASAEAAAVYILGDLFEAWVGDDMVTGDEPEFTAMRALQDRGIPLYVMRGNRD